MEIFTPPALARMPGAAVVDRHDGTRHVVDHVEHAPGQDYLICWADGSRMFAGPRHPFLQEQTGAAAEAAGR